MGSGSGSGSGNSWNSNRWNNQQAAAGSGSGSGGGHAARSGSGSGSGSGGGNWGGGNSGGHAGGSGSGSGGGGHAGGAGSGSGSGGGGHAGGSGSGSGSGGGGHAGGSGSGSGSGGGGHAGGSGSGSGSGGGNAGGSGSGSASGGGGGGGGNQNGWITGRMFNDTNADGTEANAQGAGETGIQGARVELLDTHGNVVQVAYTNNTGDYTFDVPAGAYRVHFPDLPGRDFTTQDVGGNNVITDMIDSDANAQGLTGVIHVNSGVTIQNIDAGVVPEPPTTGAITGRVSIDDDRDNTEVNTVQDDNNLPQDTGVSGQTVELWVSGGGRVASTTTDADGNYSFGDVQPGNYVVFVHGLDGHNFAQKDVGPDETDNDFNQSTPGSWTWNTIGEGAGGSHHFTVAAGQTVSNLDASFQVKQGTISGRMTLDDDRDNTEVNTVTDDNDDGLDRGIANQTVELLDTNGNVVASTTTDASGNYSFTADPGDYQVRFPEPDDHDFATQNVGDEATDSDANASGVTETITLTAGGSVSNVDASLVSELGALEGRLFIDDDKDGLDNLGPIGTDDLTLNSGTLTTDGVPGGMTAVEFNGGRSAGASLEADTIGGDLTISAWAKFDSLNGNYQRVFDFSNGQGTDNVLLTQVARTDDMMFEVYHGGGVPNTRIIVRDAIEEGEWANWTVTATASGDYTLYKDGVEVGSASTGAGIPEIERSVNLIGDSPWHWDATLDGAVSGLTVQDGTLSAQDVAKLAANPGAGLEDGQAGATVTLLNADGTPVLDSAGQPITTTTDADGDYRFDGLEAGDYRVQFELPNGRVFTTQNVGSDDAVDSDVNASGVSDVATVRAGETTSNVDAGIHDEPMGTISGRMTLDDDRDNTEVNTVTNDNDDGFDRGIANQTVELLDTSGNVVATTTTDASGNYSFTAAPGDYQVRFAEPDDHDFATQNVGDEGNDSDPDASGVTETITLGAGATVQNVDASLVTELGSIEGRVFIDADHNDVDGSYTSGTTDQVLASENFNGGASGWSNNQTGRSGDGDTYLGNHGAAGGQVTHKTFDLPDGTNTVKVEFDFLEIDSWDGERFSVFINDTEVQLGRQFVDSAYGDRDNYVTGQVHPGNGMQISYTSVSQGGGMGHRGGIGTFWNDETHKVTLTITNPGSDLKLGFGSGLNQGLQDEGWGVDNLTITAQTPTSSHSAEAGEGNVQVALLHADGSAVLDGSGQPITTTTDANGAYNFDNVIPGDYRVEFTAPDGRVFVGQDVGSDDTIDSDVDGNGLSGVISVAPGQHVSDLDAGIKDTPQGTITGRLSLDDDRDNTEVNTIANDNADAADTGLSGQTVELLDTSGNVVASTTTNAVGVYSFDVAPGDYRVHFPDVAGHEYATQDVGLDLVDSDADANGETGVITVADGQTVADVDASLQVSQGTITGRLSLDDDRDATEVNTTTDDNSDAVDEGLSGQTVELLDTSGNVVASTTTDATGGYSFNVNPGDYRVHFPDVPGYEYAPQDLGADTVDSDADADGETGVITVTAGQTVADVDASLQVTQGTISGRMTLDDDRDNTEANTVTDDNADALDRGIANQTVELLDTSGNVVASTTTDANGNYSFSADPGDYQVRFVEPAGHDFATQNVGAEDVDSDANASGVTETVTVTAGGSVTNVDASLVTEMGTISGRMTLDDDRDNTEANTVTDDNADALDRGIANQTVELLDTSGNVVASTTTDANGNYSFSAAPGDYQVRFAEPAGHDFATQNAGAEDVDSDANASGVTETITLTAGGTVSDVDASLVTELGRIEGRVSLDDDRDNLETNTVQNDNADALDTGLGGQTVYLVDDQGNEVASTTTDANGNYGFDVVAGDYQVRFEVGDNQQLAQANVGDDDTIDSDAGGRGGVTETISVSAGQTVSDVDASMQLLQGQISGRLSLDDDADDTELNTVTDDNSDPLDSGLGNQTVELLDTNGNVVASTTTDAGGNYSFDVDPGQYQVRFPTLDDHQFATQNVGSDATDSDAGANGVTDVITVGASQMVSNVDASLQPLIGRVEGRVSLDDDFDQTEANTNTDDNNNPLDEGVQGVTVELLNDNGDVVATTTTDANGGYSFDVAAGTYQVRFEGVDDHVFAQQDVGGDDAIDSDASGRGLTDQITVQGGKTTANVDASVQQNIGYIEGRVTLDDDEDNTETNSVLDDNSDPLDQGIANQTVYLLDDQGNEIASTTTDATGAYAFAVVPGDYQVRFEAGDNQRFADQNVGGDDAVDSDPNGRGLTDPISVGVGQTVDDVDASLIDETPVVGTATVKGRVFRDDNHDSLDNGEDGIGDIEVALYAADGTLVATTTTEGDGSYKFENVVAGDYYVDFNENDPDAGGRVLVTKDVDGNVSDNIDSDADQATGVTDVFSVADGQFIFNKDAGFEDPSNSSISGRYFEDSDFDGVDNGEAGLIGYDVQLLAEDGTVLRTTTTDVNGDYTFDNIDGGRYQVKFVKDDSDPREFTFRNANGDDGDDTNDSDADDNGLSPFIQVGINQDVSDVDAGLLPDPDGGIDGGPDFEDPLDGMMNQNPDDLDRGLNEEEEEDELDPMLG